MTIYIAPSACRATHIIKTNTPIQVGISAINPAHISCDRCGSFATKGSMLATKRGLLKAICQQCAMKYPALLSETSKQKLLKLQATVD